MACRQLRLRTLVAMLTSLAAFAEASVAWGQSVPENERATQTLPTVVISGSKRNQTLDGLNGAASVADRTDLDDAQAVSTLDLPRVFPDLLMANSGSQLFPIITLRGVTSAQDFYNPALTLYVDGVPQLGDTVLRPRIAARYIGAHYFDAANQLRQGGYTLFDAGLSWSPQRDLEVAFYVNNLTNKAYRTYGFSYGSLGNFAQVGLDRTVGMTLTYAY